MNTGGPAFPGTLLDWFAGQELTSRGMYGASVREKVVAKECYDIAAAMLAEKARREAVVKESQTTDHSGGSNKMVEDHFRDAAKMTKLERQNAQLLSLLRQAELAIAFANREPHVIRMLGDDYTDVLQLVRAALKDAKP